LRAILTGEDKHVFEHLKAEMRRAADQLQFERARWFRDELQFLERLAGPEGLASPVLDRNVVLLQPAVIQNRLEILVVRQGRLVESFGLDVPYSETTLTTTIDRVIAASKAASSIRGDRSETDLIRHVANWMYRTRETCTVVPLESPDEPSPLRERIRVGIQSAAKALTDDRTEPATAKGIRGV
jgi:excinuclease UvrABC nuclease subunit